MGDVGAEVERAHLAKLCARYSAPPPPDGVLHYAVQLGDFRLHWERHTEFSTNTIIAGGSPTAQFSRTAIELLPDDWREERHGEVIAACHVVVLPAGDMAPDEDELGLWFEGHRLLGSDVMGEAARVWTALRVHGDGFGRFLVHDRGLSGNQTGRLVQRLFELDTYTHMALLGLPEARRLAPQLSALEQSLARVTAATASAKKVASDRTLLDELFQLSAEVEHLQAGSAYRFGAVRAYDGIVSARLAELGETPIRGLQPLGEFLDRRFKPAVRTCISAETRMDSLSRRVGSTVDLLRTRVDLQIEQQNQAVLRSMDQRARLQLRLQQMVEGLSVVAISYYAVSLFAYFLSGLYDGGGIEAVVLTVVTPLVVFGVWFGLRRAKRSLELDAAD
jgi:uncharacterized membrane-anchored protein